MNKLLYLFLVFTIVACSDDDNGGSNSTEVYFRVTVDGQTYEETLNLIAIGGYSTEDCNGNLAFEQYLPEIGTATNLY